MKLVTLFSVSGFLQNASLWTLKSSVLKKVVTRIFYKSFNGLAIIPIHRINLFYLMLL